MMLRSAASRDIQPQVADVTAIGSFIELRSDDPAAKPWLARILSVRHNRGESIKSESDEVECEWLWHPTEVLKELDLSQYDVSTYGSRELFLGGGTAEQTKDWNPLDSIKFKVWVLPLDEYKRVAAAGFQMQLNPDDPGSLTILDPSRCWYYRQVLRSDENGNKTMEPTTLPCTVHRPNPEYHEWCHRNGISLTSEILSIEDQAQIPSRTILVPTNPERMYFYCVDCQRRFETRQGDCLDPIQINDLKMFRYKSDINIGDVQITCPLCKGNKTDYPPPNKRARTSSTVISTSNESCPNESIGQVEEQTKSDQTRREVQRKQGRYERMNGIFRKSIQEAISGGMEESLQHKDSQSLADLFFDRFEVYSGENQLNTKMEHQKLHEIFQNLKRENNVDLRRRIVTGELSIDDLIAADVKDLAPESLKKRREAEQQKYFQQQVLLSAGPESLRVIRKTHKGLEVVQDEDTPAVSPTKEENQSQKKRHASEEFDVKAIQPNDAVDPLVPEIIRSTITGRREHGPPDSDLIDLPFPLIDRWKAATSFHSDPQLLKPPEYSGIPNREQTRVLLLSKLNETKLTDKIIADMVTYADQSVYRIA